VWMGRAETARTKVNINPWKHETKNLLPTTQSNCPAHTSGRSVSAAARPASERAAVLAWREETEDIADRVTWPLRVVRRARRKEFAMETNPVRVAGEHLSMLHVWRIQARKGKRWSQYKDLGA
jgi:hypothetical protein